jgi:hypothetical protein
MNAVRGYGNLDISEDTAKASAKLLPASQMNGGFGLFGRHQKVGWSSQKDSPQKRLKWDGHGHRSPYLGGLAVLLSSGGFLGCIRSFAPDLLVLLTSSASSSPYAVRYLA